MQINGVSLTYNSCNNHANNYFALFPNFKEVAPSTYFRTNTYALVRNLVTNLTPVSSRRVMPEEFFVFMEMHFGSCGAYSQTDGRSDWPTVLSATIGFR